MSPSLFGIRNTGYHRTGGPWILTLALGIAAGFLVVMIISFVGLDIDANNIAYPLMLVLLVLGIVPAAWRYWRTRDLFQPLLIYPVVYSLVFAAPLLYEIYRRSSATAVPSPLFTEEYALDMEFMAILGLLGFYAGASVNRSPTGGVVQRSDSRSLGTRRIFGWLMALALAAQVSGILAYGVVDWFFGTYGQAQFEYGLSYYLLLSSQLLAYPAYLSCLYYCLAQRRHSTWMFIFPIIFAGLFLAQGGRGQALFLVVSGLTVANYARKRLSLRSVAFFLAIIVAIFMAGALFRLRAFDLALLPSTFKDFMGTLVGELAWGGSITTAVIDLGSLIPRQYGLTYIGAIVNLIPGFFFGTNWARPIPIPSLLFHQVYAPGVTDMGFGLSVLAEAYMNWGISGAVPVMFSIGLLLSYMHRKAARGSAFAVVMYAITLYQSLWYLRSDSVGVFKAVFYSALVLAVVELINKSAVAGVPVSSGGMAMSQLLPGVPDR